MAVPALIESLLVPMLAGLPSGRRYLVGVSGGRDSVALLHLLVGLGFRKLIVCHLDHQLRGRASGADARFVARLAAKFGFPSLIEKADVARIAKEKRLSIETAARMARIDFFARVARAKHCSTIFLGHHADDQVETFLFNLFRGAGPAGLGGMRSESQRGGLRVVRPMLGIWRSEIDAYVTERHLKFRDDASNAQSAATRNRMRHEIIPALEKWFGREIKKSVWRSAEILAAENEWAESSIEKPSRELSVAALRAMPLGQQRRVIFSWLKLLRVSDCGFGEAESVRALIQPASGKSKINLPGGLHARRRSGKLFVE